MSTQSKENGRSVVSPYGAGNTVTGLKKIELMSALIMASLVGNERGEIYERALASVAVRSANALLEELENNEKT